MLRVLTLSSLFPDATRPTFGVFVERQTLGLAACGEVSLVVVAPVGLPPWPLSRHPQYRDLAQLAPVEDWKGLEVHRPRFMTLPGTGGRWHVAALVRCLIPLLANLRRDFAFDVIDAEFFFPDGPAAIALSRHFGVPVSIKARGADIHHWGHGVTAGQVRVAGRAADGMLAVSQAMRADMIALGMPGERIRVHHTGVDLARFAPLNRSIAKQKWGVTGPLIVSLGALIERKGHGIVIEAMRDVPSATLLIVGEGGARAALTADIERHGLGDRVRLIGALPHVDLPALLGAADVMALASASEGLANAWVEALACGTPIVITDAGGAAEVVTEPHYGRIVPRTAKAFARAIADLLVHPPEQSAVRRGAEHFTWGTNSVTLFAHLDALVAAHRRD